jgi:hypothetical protein
MMPMVKVEIDSEVFEEVIVGLTALARINEEIFPKEAAKYNGLIQQLEAAAMIEVEEGTDDHRSVRTKGQARTAVRTRRQRVQS